MGEGGGCGNELQHETENRRELLLEGRQGLRLEKGGTIKKCTIN